ncbi:Uu.00g135240.m01.CDS01 [Anthostomella pinea]|uniref:Uu.00g135240.m01.CDS01 n=1 Tax=Anthostomella pinea TaxID=933095 RepID=A0AAI8VPR4_9PEZI|nr:Uu.00g135240.m01.CDS01 [Anthostomella pinea]
MVKVNFNPETEIPSLQGKVFLITGGTAGLGKETLKELAKHKPAHLYFTGRNQKSADAIISELKAIDASVGMTFLECDFGSRASIVKAAERFHSDRLDVFIASAGLMAVPAETTVDGYEIQFGTSHMGNFTLLALMLPIMLRTAKQPDPDVRYVALTSLGYGLHPKGGIIFDTLKSKQEDRNTWVRYGQSKLANILTTKELARRHPTITSVVLHPGTVKTGLVDNLSFANRMIVYVTNPQGLMTPEQGACNMLWASTTRKENLKPGQFYTPVGQAASLMREGENMELARRLWEWSEKEIAGLKLG